MVLITFWCHMIRTVFYWTHKPLQTPCTPPERVDALISEVAGNRIVFAVSATYEKAKYFLKRVDYALMISYRIIGLVWFAFGIWQEAQRC